MTRIALVFDTDGTVDPEWLKHAQSLTHSPGLLYMLPGGVQVVNIFKVPDDGQVGVISGVQTTLSPLDAQTQKKFPNSWSGLTKTSQTHLGVSGSGLVNAVTGMGLSAKAASEGLKKLGDSSLP